MVIGYSISLVALESTVHKLALKLLARTVSFTMSWSDYLMSFLQKVPFVVAGTLIFVCITTCGSLALCLGALFYFLKLTQMSQEYIEEVVWFIVKNFAKRCKKALSKKKATKEKPQENVSQEVAQVIPDENSEKTDERLMEYVAKENEGETSTVKGNNANETDEKNTLQVDKCVIVKNKSDEALNNEDNQYKELTEDKCEENRDLTGEHIKETINDSDETQNVEKKEKKPEESNTELSTGYNAIFFHSTLFFLWCIITLINIPAVLTWAHNFKFSKSLTPDDSFIPGLALSLCAFPLWQCDFPRTDRKWFDILEGLVMIVAIISLIFATVSLYRLNYLLTLTLVIITLQQLFAPKKSDSIEEVGDDNEDKETRAKYDKIKAKLD